MEQKSIKYMQIRGGSSKGIYFLKDDLPQNENERNEVILDIVGRDARQIDGLGGAHPLTSKVGIISKSQKPGVDIDYLFVQVVVGENRVDTAPNCGNILSGVGVFAIEQGLIKANENETKIVVNMLNSDSLCELVLQTPNKELIYTGLTKIDGVPGTSSAIICNYLDTKGAICGELFPTKNQIDEVDGVKITCIDNGMPVVLLDAKDFGISGYESCKELEANVKLKEKVESIRLKAGKMMNLGDVSKKVIPKMTLISPATNGGFINTRTFIPHNCHTAIGVLGAVSVATACLFENSVVSKVINLKNGVPKEIVVEHPSGNFVVNLESEKVGNEIELKSAGIIRTARLLSRGLAYIHK